MDETESELTVDRLVELMKPAVEKVPLSDDERRVWGDDEHEAENGA